MSRSPGGLSEKLRSRRLGPVPKLWRFMKKTATGLIDMELEFPRFVGGLGAYIWKPILGLLFVVYG